MTKVNPKPVSALEELPKDGYLILSPDRYWKEVHGEDIQYNYIRQAYLQTGEELKAFLEDRARSDNPKAPIRVIHFATIDYSVNVSVDVNLSISK